MMRSIRQWLAIWLAGLLLSGMAAAAQGSDFHLDIHRAGEPEVLHTMRLGADGDWCLHWRHSVTGFMVRDCFKVADGQLLLRHSHQPDFAAGLDHIPGRGRLESDGVGGYSVRDIDEPVADNTLRLRVAIDPEGHRIVSEAGQLNLSREHAGESIEIRLRAVP